MSPPGKSVIDHGQKFRGNQAVRKPNFETTCSFSLDFDSSGAKAHHTWPSYCVPFRHLMFCVYTKHYSSGFQADKKPNISDK